jgi:O-antigen/teichoic acid export membrane protein
LKDANAQIPIRARTSLVENSRWNLLAFACGLAANFITIPFVVRWTSLEIFGQAGLVLAVCAPLTLIGTVLGQALVREMSSRQGPGEEEVAGRTLDAALRLCLLASAVAWVLLVVGGSWITSFLTGKEAHSQTLALAFLVAATGWFAQQFSLVLQGTCAARQDFRSIARVAAFSAVASIGATLGITWALPTLEGYLFGVAAGFVLTLGGWLFTLRHGVRWRKVFGGYRKPELAALLHFGKWQGLAQLAGAFGNQIDRYALGALAPVAIVGQYNVANRLQEAAYIGVVKAGEVLFPRFGSLSASSTQERCRFFQIASWVMGTFSAALLAPLVPLAGTVLTLWVGAEAANGGAQLLGTLVLGGIVGAGSNVFVYYAMGIGRNAPVAFISVLYSVITVVFTVLLIKTIGPLAAGAGLLVASVVRFAAALVITRRNFFPQLPWGELVVSAVLPLAVGLSIALAAQGIGVGHVLGWIHLIALYAALGAAVVVATVAMTALTGSGRKILSQTYLSLRSSLKP